MHSPKSLMKSEYLGDLWHYDGEWRSVLHNSFRTRIWHMPQFHFLVCWTFITSTIIKMYHTKPTLLETNPVMKSLTDPKEFSSLSKNVNRKPKPLVIRLFRLPPFTGISLTFQSSKFREVGSLQRFHQNIPTSHSITKFFNQLSWKIDLTLIITE